MRNKIVDSMWFLKHFKISGRGNASGSSTPRLGDQSNFKALSSNKRQNQRCRNDCVKEFMKCAVCEFVFHAKCEGGFIPAIFAV